MYLSSSSSCWLRGNVGNVEWITRGVLEEATAFLFFDAGLDECSEVTFTDCRPEF